MNIEVHLPFPPTVNSYYVKTRNGVFISAKGKQFRHDSAEMLNEQVGALNIAEPMLVEVILYMPDRRKRDLDNYMKALLDALTVAELWLDDSLIHQLFVYRGEVTKGGKTIVRIWDAEPILPLDYELGLYPLCVLSEANLTACSE